MAYASDAICLDVVFARDAGWTTVPTEPMSLMMFHCDDLMDFSSEPFRLARQATPNRFQRFVGCDLDEES